MELEAETLQHDEYNRLTQEYEISSQKKEALRNSNENDAKFVFSVYI
jgi:hypothetical protein